MQVNAAVLNKVVEWCEHHKHDPPTTHDDDDARRKASDIDEWDQKFMQVDQEMLFEIILVRGLSSLSITAHANQDGRLQTTLISKRFWMSVARLLPT